MGLQWKELLVLPLSNDEIVKLEGAIHAALQESEGDSRGIENLLYIVRVLRCRDVDAPIRTLEGVRGTCIVLVVHPLPSFPAVFTNARWTAPRLLLVARNITPPCRYASLALASSKEPSTKRSPLAAALTLRPHSCYRRHVPLLLTTISGSPAPLDWSFFRPPIDRVQDLVDPPQCTNSDVAELVAEARRRFGGPRVHAVPAPAASRDAMDDGDSMADTTTTTSASAPPAALHLASHVPSLLSRRLQAWQCAPAAVAAAASSTTAADAAGGDAAGGVSSPAATGASSPSASAPAPPLPGSSGGLAAPGTKLSVAQLFASAGGPAVAPAPHPHSVAGGAPSTPPLAPGTAISVKELFASVGPAAVAASPAGYGPAYGMPPPPMPAVPHRPVSREELKATLLSLVNVRVVAGAQSQRHWEGEGKAGGQSAALCACVRGHRRRHMTSECRLALLSRQDDEFISLLHRAYIARVK